MGCEPGRREALGPALGGSGGFASPGISSYENVLATAETLNALGQASVENGTGKIFGHNHTAEFATKYVDVQGDGTLKSAWQILVENTDPRYVTFQLDVGWATVAGEDAVALVEEFGDRIELLHIKDAIVTGRPTPWEQTIIGQGDVDWASLFAAAQGKVKLYVLEQDPPARGTVRVHRGELRVRRLPGLLSAELAQPEWTARPAGAGRLMCLADRSRRRPRVGRYFLRISKIVPVEEDTA